MAIIKDCEIWFAKLDPKRPNAKYNKENPTWECQIRTTSKEVKKLWESLNLSVKAVVPDEGAPYFRVNLRKKSVKEDTEKASPVKVVNGALEDIDPNTLGNGSIGNIRIFQYEYPKNGGKERGIASVLMGIQVTKHIVYKAKPRDDDFEMTDTETLDNGDMTDDGDESEQITSVSTPSTPKLGAGVSAKPSNAF
jgi:hypothetical protein